MDFGSLSERCKGRPDGAYPCQRSCQRLPSLAEKNKLFLLRLYGSHFSLSALRAPGSSTGEELNCPL